LASSDQSGTVYLQQSRDGSTFRNVTPVEAGISVTTVTASNGIAVAANNSIATQAEWKISERYVRVVYINGATAQTAFDLNCALVAA
jgi:hypothetical protein